MKRSVAYIGILVLLFATGCEPEVDIRTPESGQADLTTYISYGDEWGSGYMNGGTDAFRQAYSIPALMADRFAMAGLESFKQPVLPAGYSLGKNSIPSFDAPICDKDYPLPFVMREDGQNQSALRSSDISADGPFHNLCFPKLGVDVLGNPDCNNPFLNYIAAPGSSNCPYRQVISAQQPTFFSLHIGHSGILDYAGKGAVSVGSTTDLVSLEALTASLDQLFSIIKNPEGDMPEGVVFSIPDFTLMPYFTYLGPTFPDIKGCSDKRFPVYVTTQSGEIRIAGDGDFILLPALDYMREFDPNGKPNGTSQTNPLPDAMVLDKDEASEILELVYEINGYLAHVCAENNWVLVDVQAIQQEVAETRLYNGFAFTNNLVTGDFYSLDGIFPSPRGNALIVNEVIREMNDQYEMYVPELNVLEYPDAHF